MSPHDIDPRQSSQVIEDLATADAQARPVIARAGAGVPNAVIVAGFGVMGVGLFLWMSAHRADAKPAPSLAAQAVSTQATPTGPMPLPANGPLYAVPAPQFTENNSIPQPQIIAGAEAADKGLMAKALRQALLHEAHVFQKGRVVNQLERLIANRDAMLELSRILETTDVARPKRL